MEDTIDYILAAKPDVLNKIMTCGLVVGAVLFILSIMVIHRTLALSRLREEFTLIKERFAPVIELDAELNRITDEKERITQQVMFPLLSP